MFILIVLFVSTPLIEQFLVREQMKHVAKEAPKSIFLVLNTAIENYGDLREKCLISHIDS